MFENRTGGIESRPADRFSGLLNTADAPVAFGYVENNEIARPEAVEWNAQVRQGPIDWWDRHRGLRLGVAGAVVLSLAFIPAVQDAVFALLGHVH